ncbi:MAG: type II secretion system F family protein [Bacillota bacterium]|nr:type II secretion system F family protein [Bacillota bacterium]
MTLVHDGGWWNVAEAAIALVAICGGLLGVIFQNLGHGLSLRGRWGALKARVAQRSKPRRRRKAAVAGRDICALCEILANGLRCGQGLLQSLSLAAAELEGPLGEALKHAIRQFTAGIPLSRALGDAEQDLQNLDFAQVVRAIEVFKETGGNASEALGQVAKAVREREEMRAILGSHMADAQASSVIVAAMPFVLGALSYATQPGTFMSAARTIEGQCAFGLGAALWMTGAYLTWRITHPGWL